MGFRPFVQRLAVSLGLGGEVGNDAQGVWCEVEGSPDTLKEFADRLLTEAPPLAQISGVKSRLVPPLGLVEFRIANSVPGQVGVAVIPPDVAPCEACLAEVAEPDNRRAGYVFTCCTDCGPRYTVVRDLPYDRQRTTLEPFPLCAQCQAEYEDPASRRFHAQATCCALCGPKLELTPNPTEADPLAGAVELLRAGNVLALKGLGGYQLLCRSDQADPVRLLRERKRREEKPFALLVASLEQARSVASLDPRSERALTGPEAPIVLAPAVGGGVVAEVAPRSSVFGIMLPATPLHLALVAGVGVPLVCTSGNRSEEPIVVDDDLAVSALAGIADAILSHNRPIQRRADDSVGHVVASEFQLLRRARGFAPRPVALGATGPVVLGVGAELKSTTCLAVADQAGLSVHLGDLENPATLAAFESAIADQLALSGATPELVVHDLHPEYLSTKFALAQDLAPTLAVQHHHAHLVSCLVDNGHAGPAVGVTFDGLGWGTDGTAWGGEFLIGNASGFTRAAHLQNVALPGGAAAIRAPWRMAVAHLLSAFGADLPGLPLLSNNADALDTVVALAQNGHSTMTSSMGRLFDAVASLCGVADSVTYEGQAAIGLEQLADPGAQGTYPYEVRGSAPLVIDPAPTLRAIVEDLRNNVSSALVAGRFHLSVAQLIADVCGRLREQSGISTVALSGGVFQNRLLVELAVPRLEGLGFEVLRHRQVPPNDGGISLGQVAIGRAAVNSDP